MRRWPWTPITARHIAQARKLKSARDVVVFFTSLVLGCELDCPPPNVHFDRPIHRADVDRLSGYRARQVRMAFEQLELVLEVRRKFTGSSSSPSKPFQLELPWGNADRRGAALPLQRGSTGGRVEPLQRGSTGGRVEPITPYDRARNPVTDPPAKEEPSVRSGAGTDGRLEKLAWELWPEQHKPFGREYLAMMRAHELAPTDAELAAFLRALSEDAKRSPMTQPLAVGAKSDRLTAWLKRRRRLRVVVPRPRDVEEISESEREAVRSMVLDWTKGKARS